MNSKKIAFVHDWIYHRWWAETVMVSLYRHCALDQPVTFFCMWSDRRYLEIDWHIHPIVTALPYWIFRVFVRCEKQQIPFFKMIFDYRNLMFFYPVLIWILEIKIRISSPDVVVIDSFACAKNVRTQGQRIIYFHSALEYVRWLYEYNLSKLPALIKPMYRFATWYLRYRDKQQISYDTVYANSLTTAKRIKKLYNLDSKVRYPAIDPEYEWCEILAVQDYYVFVGRLVIFSKDLDQIIYLFNMTKKRLVIIWDGPDRAYLESIAWDTIEFLWVCRGQQKMDIVWAARGLISLGIESFGMVVIEALCQWVPVMTYSKSAAAEFIDHTTGIVVDTRSLDVLSDSLISFDQQSRDRHAIQSSWRAKYARYAQCP